MKVVLAFLVIAAISGLIGGITGVQQYHSGANGTHIVRYDAAGRIVVLSVGVLSAVGAYGCIKLKHYGWWIVAVAILALIGITAWGIVRLLVAAPEGAIYVVCVWLVEIFLLVLAFRWWRVQRKRFSSYENKA